MATGDDVIEMITGYKRPNVQAPEGAAPELVARFEKAKTDCYEWDRLLDEGHALDRNSRPFGPNRKASSRCQSGGHDYCTCDTCF